MCRSTSENPIECKSDPEIYDWLKRKFVIAVANSKRFVLEEFDDNRIKKEARLTWIPINSQLREEKIFMVQTKLLTLKDTVFQFGQVTK